MSASRLASLGVPANPIPRLTFVAAVVRRPAGGAELQVGSGAPAFVTIRACFSFRSLRGGSSTSCLGGERIVLSEVALPRWLLGAAWARRQVREAHGIEGNVASEICREVGLARRHYAIGRGNFELWLLFILILLGVGRYFLKFGIILPAIVFNLDGAGFSDFVHQFLRFLATFV